MKHGAKTLPVLSPHIRVWVKSPSDKGEEGTVVRVDSNPESYWVPIRFIEIRRNRNHLFLLEMTKEEGFKPSESSPKQWKLVRALSVEWNLLIPIA